MFADWNSLTDEAQIALSQQALHRAAAQIAVQAELLADEIECGGLSDRGGPDALRLFAAMVRAGTRQDLVPAGSG